MVENCALRQLCTFRRVVALLHLPNHFPMPSSIWGLEQDDLSSAHLHLALRFLRSQQHHKLHQRPHYRHYPYSLRRPTPNETPQKGTGHLSIALRIHYRLHGLGTADFGYHDER